MKLQDIVLVEGWTTVKTKLATDGVYEVDLVKNFISSSKIELYARVITAANKPIKNELVYSGPENEVNMKDVEQKAKEVLASMKK